MWKDSNCWYGRLTSWHITESYLVQAAMFTADGAKSIRKLLDPVQEPFRPEMSYYESAKEIGVYDMWQIQAQRTEFCKSYLERWNQCAGLDAILCKSILQAWPSTH
jgi:amidase